MLVTTFDKTCSDVESAILATMTEQGIPAAAHDFVVTSNQDFFNPLRMEVTMLYKPLMFRRRFSIEYCAGIMPIEYKRYFRDQIYLFVKDIRKQLKDKKTV